MTTNTQSLLPFLCLVLLGCDISVDGGSDSSDYAKSDIINQQPKGLHGGNSWSMTVAEVKPSPFEAGALSVSLFAEQVKTCAHASASKAYIRFSVKKSTGEYPLGLGKGQSVTFITPPANNTVAMSGIIAVEALAEEQVTIGVIADGGADYQVNGRFTAELCDD